MKLFRSDL